jgi:hypothetical protein
MCRINAALAFSLWLLCVLVVYPVADASAQQQSGGQYKSVQRHARHATRHSTRQRDNETATYRSELSRAKSEWRHVQHSGIK